MTAAQLDIETLRYPVGKFSAPSVISPDDIEQWIHTIEKLPQQVRNAVKNLTDVQLDTPYRDGGWTVRQVVHHVPDSHMNAYIRFKLALTEENPTIRPYLEDRWAELPDGKSAPIAVSLDILEAIRPRHDQADRSATVDGDGFSVVPVGDHDRQFAGSAIHDLGVTGR